MRHNRTRQDKTNQIKKNSLIFTVFVFVFLVPPADTLPLRAELGTWTLFVRTGVLVKLGFLVPVPVKSSDVSCFIEGRENLSVFFKPSLSFTEMNEFDFVFVLTVSCSYSVYVLKLADFLCQFLPNFILI